ncbi:MAG TPA: hypothetical protein VM260_08155, partial [Pirellula sp.]|nr:hypothetical protein [Pirellula sp.]
KVYRFPGVMEIVVGNWKSTGDPPKVVLKLLARVTGAVVLMIDPPMVPSRNRTSSVAPKPLFRSSEILNSTALTPLILGVKD